MTVGLSYPLEITESGNLSLSTGNRLIEEHAISILETLPGERVMRREFGMPNRILSELSTQNMAILDSTLENALASGSPEDLSSVSVAGDRIPQDGVYRVRISYNGRTLPLNLSN